MRSTHTYVVMQLSPACWNEILEKMLAADYRHAINGQTIDMHGIAVEPIDERASGFLRAVAPHQEISSVVFDRAAITRANAEDGEQPAEEDDCGVTVDLKGNLVGSPEAIARFESFCSARPALTTNAIRNASPGEEGTEQFVVMIQHPDGTSREQKIHDPFITSTVINKITRWAAFCSIFRGDEYRTIKTVVSVRGSHSAFRRIMSMNPYEMQIENEQQSAQCVARDGEQPLEPGIEFTAFNRS